MMPESSRGHDALALMTHRTGHSNASGSNSSGMCDLLACDLCVVLGPIVSKQGCTVSFSRLLLHSSYIGGLKRLWTQDEDTRCSFKHPDRCRGALTSRRLTDRTPATRTHAHPPVARRTPARRSPADTWQGPIPGPRWWRVCGWVGASWGFWWPPLPGPFCCSQVHW